MNARSFTFNSTSLNENLIGESTRREVMVYLPYGYEESEQNYPVIYYLAGFSGNSHEIITGSAITSGAEGAGAIDRSIRDGIIKECIVVGISGINKLGGSFYTNSPVIGNWEDHILEIVEEVDSRYRTVNNSSSRGLAGFSMGGFGAINVGLKHPDVFGSVYAFSPGLFSESGFDAEVWSTWHEWDSVLRSYGAAFNYDLSIGSSPFAKIPEIGMNYTEVVDGWKDLWSSGYGDIDGKVSNYIAKNIPLSAIRVDYAQNDRFTWLIKGSKELYSKLSETDTAVYQDEIAGFEHNINSSIVENHLIPFFGSQFK